MIVGLQLTQETMIFHTLDGHCREIKQLPQVVSHGRSKETLYHYQPGLNQVSVKLATLGP